MSEERTVGAIATAVVAVVALVLSAGALIMSASAPASAGASDTPTDGSGAPSSASVTLTEFAIDPDGFTIAAGGTLEVANGGSIDHDLSVQGADVGTPMISGGDAATLELGDLAPGTYQLRCTVPGHDSAGMTASLTVVGEGSDKGVVADGAQASGDTDAVQHEGHGMDADWGALDAAMQESMLAFPAETEGRGNQPLEPSEVLDDGTKVFDLVAEIIQWEVAPGQIVDGWSYNGQIPGPMIKVDVGDKVRVRVENRLPLNTDVHWHGVRVPNSQDGVAPYTQDPIAAGETYTYEFVAEEPSIGMYHPHVHGQMKLPNGMFGLFLIGDLGSDIPLPAGRTIAGRTIPADLEIAAEIPMVLNDAGTIGMSLNGKSFPATEPIVVDQGDWIVIHYYNEGLQIHPMHLHQSPQLVFAKDGFPLESPRWEDTVSVAPGERYSVLVPATDPGTWVFHCHILNHVERDEGMFGMVTAMIVEE